MRWLLALTLLSALMACGIKAAPKPPLTEVTSPPPEPPRPTDGGCCREPK